MFAHPWFATVDRAAYGGILEKGFVGRVVNGSYWGPGACDCDTQV